MIVDLGYALVPFTAGFVGGGEVVIGAKGAGIGAAGHIQIIIEILRSICYIYTVVRIMWHLGTELTY